MNGVIRIIVVVLLLNLSAGALYGSWVLISDPSGSKFFLSVDLLSKSPFQSYLLPGIILLLVNGLLPLVLLFLVAFRNRYYKRLLILQGCLLCGWLSIQLLISKEFFFPVMHYSCYATGVLLVIFGLMLMKLDQVELKINVDDSHS